MTDDTSPKGRGIIFGAAEFSGAKPIDAYGAGGFRIGGQRYEGAVFVMPSGVFDWVGGFDARAFAPAIARRDEIDVLLVGMGAQVARLPEDMAHFLASNGLAPDPMGTDAACRTYNVLLSEGRRVGAALLAV